MQTIKEIRQTTGLSQAKFAAALHIPLRTVQAWEIGERSCPEYAVELIAYRVQHDPQFKTNYLRPAAEECTPLIDKETWEKVQAATKERKEEKA